MINRIFDFKISEKATNEFYDHVKVILKEGFLSDHTYCRELENELNLYSCAFNAATFSNATSALFAAFSLLPEGTNVLMQSNTLLQQPRRFMLIGLILTF